MCCNLNALYNFVTERLALGEAIRDRDHLQLLLDEGITHILDLEVYSDETSFLMAYAPHIIYLDAGIPDDWTEKPTEWFQQGIDFALNALDTPHHKVYVHCTFGVSRSSSMVYAILRALGHDSASAQRMIEDVRYVHINHQSDAERALHILGYA